MIRPLVLAAALWGAAHAANAGCGSDEAACEIENGIYDIELPGNDNPPLVIFLHGYGGNGANVMKNRGMIDTILARGYAFAAPSGERRVGEGAGRSWNFYPGWEGRDETGFLQDVVADAAERFDVNPDRVILSGFSAGGFMVYYSACDTPDAFSGLCPGLGAASGAPIPKVARAPSACSIPMDGPTMLFRSKGVRWAEDASCRGIFLPVWRSGERRMVASITNPRAFQRPAHSCAAAGSIATATACWSLLSFRVVTPSPAAGQTWCWTGTRIFPQADEPYSAGVAEERPSSRDFNSWR